MDVLGIFIDNKIKFQQHITNIIMLKIRRLYSTFYHLSKITNYSTKKVIFQSFVRPHILYATPFIMNSDKNMSNNWTRRTTKQWKSSPIYIIDFHQANYFQKQISLTSPWLFKYIPFFSSQNILCPFGKHIKILSTKKKRKNFIIDPHKNQNICESFNKLENDIKDIYVAKHFKTMITLATILKFWKKLCVVTSFIRTDILRWFQIYFYICFDTSS